MSQVNAATARVTAVVAGNRAEFGRMISAIVKDLTADFIKKEGSAAIGDRMYIYVESAQHLRMMNPIPDRVIYYGTYVDRPDLKEIRGVAETLRSQH